MKVKVIGGIVGMILVALAIWCFVPQERRPQALRCAGCWYGSEWICSDKIIGFYNPTNGNFVGKSITEGQACPRNFMM